MLNLAPDEGARAHGLYVRGNVLAVMGRLEEAINDYDRALRIEDGFTTHACRGLALLCRGDPPGAKGAFARARSAAGGEGPAAPACSALLALAEVYPGFDREGLARARSILDSQAPHSNRMMAYAHLAHGVVRFREGDRVGAWSSLASSDPHWQMAPRIGLLYAQACLDAGALEEGDRALRDLLRIRPDLVGSIAWTSDEARRLLARAAGEAAEVAGRSPAEVRERLDEFESERCEASRIASLERAYRFEEAASRWDRLGSLRSERLRARAARNAARDRVLHAEHARLVADLEGRRLDLPGFQVANLETRLVGGGRSGIEMETAESGPASTGPTSPWPSTSRSPAPATRLRSPRWRSHPSPPTLASRARRGDSSTWPARILTCARGPSRCSPSASGSRRPGEGSSARDPTGS